MGFSEIYEEVEKFLFKMFDNWVLVGIAIGLVVLLFVGGLIFLIVKLTYHPSQPAENPDTIYIRENALMFCNEKGFNAWRFKNVSGEISLTQFECYIAPNETKSIEKFLNMT